MERRSPTGPTPVYCSRRCRRSALTATYAARYAPAPKKPSTVDPEEARRRRSDQNRRRWARTHGAHVERFTARSVFERDGWYCRLCGVAVDRNVVAPHPMSATIDHIVPLAKGGAHALANVQCAHFWCNASKSDRLVAARVDS